jgi:DNA repair protein RadA/Sms
MDEHGLQEIPDINRHLLNEASFSPGSALISSLEGSRPVLLELQALLVATKFGLPQRVISGVDQKQVILLAAILEKYLRIRLSEHDIFFKVGGGFKIKESNADLGIALALLSTYFQESLPEKTIALGEISLTGHIKPINHIHMHLKEAEKFGFAHAIIAHAQHIPTTQMRIIRCSTVYDLLNLFTNNQ